MAKGLLLAVLLGLAPQSPLWLGLELSRGAAGVKVGAILPESPAAGADVRPGDEILAVGGTRVAATEQVVAAVQRVTPGSAVELRLRAPAGAERVVRLVPVPRPDFRALQRRHLLNKPAPDFRPRTLLGAKVPALSQLRGQVVLLDFFATWCGPCMGAMPELARLQQRYGPRGLRVLGLSTEPEETVRRGVAELDLPYTIANDVNDAAWRSYLITTLPTLVLVDRRGTVRAVLGNDPAGVEQALQGLLAEGS